MKIYLAGPMRGIPEYNAPVFRSAATHLRELGHEVWSPLEADLELVGGTEAASLDIRGTFRRDLDALLQQDAVVLLEGWHDSEGACLERHTADVCRIPVFMFNPATEGSLSELCRHDWRWRSYPRTYK